MKKVFIFSLISCLFLFLQVFSKLSESVILKSLVIESIDGKSFGVNGEVFGLILQNRRELRKRIYGITTQSGEKIGMYEFEEQKYCLQELVNIERDLDESNVERKDLLRKVLEEAKDDFLDFTIGYVDGIAGVKDYILSLLEDFFEKRKQRRCFLLRWCEVEYGHEEKLIREKILTFKDFTEFCIDLADFLEALARSCPKGKKQFIQMIKKAKESRMKG